MPPKLAHLQSIPRLTVSQPSLHRGTRARLPNPHGKATDKGVFFKMRNYMMNVNGNLRAPLTEALSACAGASKRLINRMKLQL